MRGLASPHPFLGANCWLVLLVMMHLVLFFRRSCWSSKLWRFRSCSSSAWSVAFLSLRICRLSWSRLLVGPLRFLSCLSTSVVNVLVMQDVQVPRVRRGEDSCSLSCSSLRRRRCRLVATVFLPVMLVILRGTALCRRREIHYRSLPVPRGCWYVAISSGGGSFSPEWCLRFCVGQRFADEGKYTFNYFQFQEVVGCVCMLHFWFSSNDDICPDNYNYSRFKLKDKCRSVKWEVYLYGDKTIQVVCTCSSWTVVTCPLL